MPPILTAAALRKVDAATISDEGITSLELMERAAAACTSAVDELIRTEFPLSQQRIIILCGRGNNGGDGWVIARRLFELRYEVMVIDFALGQPSPDNAANRQRAEQFAIPIHTLSEGDDLPVFPERSLIIDAIFGTGLNRPVSGGWAHKIEQINLLGLPIWSVDIPSGVFTDQPTNSTAVRAQRCLSLGYPKLAEFAAENAIYYGTITRVEFALVAADDLMDTPRELIAQPRAQEWLRPRDKFGHKGTFGHALLVGGSYGSIGAAVLAARATLRAGVGKLTCLLPACGYQIMQTAVPEAMCLVDDHQRKITQLPTTEAYAAVGIGPGIGRDFTTATALHQFLTTVTCPVVFDADALNILAENPAWLDLLPPGSVLTPHPKEFDRLFGEHADTFGRWETQLEAAQRLECTILLKGAYTTVADATGFVTYNPTGNPGMGTAGMGDVLTGIITALLAQGYQPEIAARLGCYFHGLAGDLGADAGAMESLIASDVVDYLGAAFAALREQ